MVTKLRAAVLVGLLALLIPHLAFAERTDDLIRALDDPSWRVRLQAIIVLGKLRDARAVPAIIRTLTDPDENVRGVAVTVLGELGDANAATAIARLRSDPSANVRQKVATALVRLEKPPSVSAKAIYVALGGFGSKAKATPPYLTARLREMIFKELQHSPGVTLEGRPLSGFLIDSSITMLTRKITPEWVEVTCEISLIVGRLPEKSMVMMTSGGATVQSPRLGFKPDTEAGMQLDALEGAVKGAHQNLLAFIKAQNGG